MLGAQHPAICEGVGSQLEADIAESGAAHSASLLVACGTGSIPEFESGLCKAGQP